MSVETRSRSVSPAPFAHALAIWGPVIIVVLADTDVGNVVTAAARNVKADLRR